MSRHRNVRNLRHDDYDDGDGYDDYDYSEDEVDADTAQYLWTGSSSSAPPPQSAATAAAEEEEAAHMDALAAEFRVALGVSVDRATIDAALVASNFDADAALAALQAELKGVRIDGDPDKHALARTALSPIGRAMADATDTHSPAAMPPLANGAAENGEAFVAAGKAVLPQPADAEARVQVFDFSAPSPDDIVIAKRNRGRDRVESAQKMKLKLPKPSSCKNGVAAGVAANATERKAEQSSEESDQAEKQSSDAQAAPSAPVRKERGKGGKGPKLRLPKRAAPRAPKQPQDGQRNQQLSQSERKQVVQRVKKMDVAQAAQKKQEKESSVSIVVAGHVDAGKSTLLGHLLSLTSGATCSSNAKNERRQRKGADGKKRDLAWTTDEDAVERERGVTIDICTRVFETERNGKRRRFAMVDAPGHRDFVPAMILGTMQASAAVLVVDASHGEFEAGVSDEGQTREHALLLRAMGVSRLIVAVNKLDAIEFSKERYDEVVKALRPFLSKAGWRVRDVVFLPVAGRAGVNLTNRAPASCPMSKWYSGPTFLTALENLADAADATTAQSIAEMPSRPTRMLVADAFRSVSLGGVIALSGRLLAGSVAPRDRLVLHPSGEVATVKSVELNGGRVPVAIAGVDNTPVSVGLIDVSDALLVSPGDVLCDPAAQVPVVTRFRAQIVTIATPVPLLQGSAVEVHVGGGCEAGSLHRLVELCGRADADANGRKKRPRRLVKGDSAVVDVKVERAVCVERAKDVKALGRFTLRAHGRTVAAGIVLEILKTRKSEKVDGECSEPIKEES